MTGTERKVFQKYYPPDYDPRKIPKAKQAFNRQFVQRVMAPCNMTCNTCGEYVYKGKKFNMRRETAEGEFYLGLKIFRFYFRCPNCLAEITFKTDLENVDYKLEHGATRLFEAHKFMIQQQKEEDAKIEAEKADPMKNLELRTKMSKAELDALGELEEIREMNRQKAGINYQSVLDQCRSENEAERLARHEREDEEYARSLFTRSADGKPIKRLKDDSDSDDDLPGPSSSKRTMTGASSTADTSDLKPDDSAFKTPMTYVMTKKPPADQPSSSSPSNISTSTSSTKPSPLVKKKPNLLSNLVVIKKPKPNNSSTKDSTGLADETPKTKSDNDGWSKIDAVDGPSSSTLTSTEDSSKKTSVLGLLGAYGSDSNSDDSE